MNVNAYDEFVDVLKLAGKTIADIRIGILNIDDDYLTPLDDGFQYQHNFIRIVNGITSDDLKLYDYDPTGRLCNGISGIIVFNDGSWIEKPEYLNLAKWNYCSVSKIWNSKEL